MRLHDGFNGKKHMQIDTYGDFLGGVFVKSVNNGATLSNFDVMAVDQRFKVSQVLSI